MRRFLSIVILFSFVFSSANNLLETKPLKKELIPELVLVFTKTTGWRHKSIPKGVQTLRELGRENSFIVLQTETAADFNPQNLRNYKLVIFLNTTQEVLNDEQQKAFEAYVKNGGSFMGIHAACDTEYEWEWYGKLVGAYFNGHPNNPNVRKANINVLDKTHPASSFLPDVWTRDDEWYNYKDINQDIKVLMQLDESSYQGGTNGENHPIAWYQEINGARAFYTGGGHTKEAYDEPLFRQHLLGAMEWCLGRK